MPRWQTCRRMVWKKFLKLEKLESMKKESVLKERFHLSRRYLYQNGKTENMPVVAGRLVTYHNKKLLKSFNSKKPKGSLTLPALEDCMKVIELPRWMYKALVISNTQPFWSVKCIRNSPHLSNSVGELKIASKERNKSHHLSDLQLRQSILSVRHVLGRKTTTHA